LAAQSIPPIIHYQGQFLDAKGTPVPTGDYEVQVQLFNFDSGGAAIWGPQNFNGQSGTGLAPKVSVVLGRFNMVVGPQDTAGHDLAGVLATNASLFLEVKVGTGRPISPRQRVLSTPYTLRAANTANALNAENGVNARNLTNAQAAASSQNATNLRAAVGDPKRNNSHFANVGQVSDLPVGGVSDSAPGPEAPGTGRPGGPPHVPTAK
jgi:hypothetical protein